MPDVLGGGQDATREDEAALLPLHCPYCGDYITAELTYSGGSWSEHRDLTGYECDNYACDARWDKRGEPERGPRTLEPSVVVEPLEVPQ